MITDNRFTHLYFDREISKLDITDEVIRTIDNQPRKIITCTSWSSLPDKLNQKVKTICFHENELKYSSAIEIVNMVNTLSKLVNVNHKITLTVAITKNINYSTIKLLQQSDILGIIPIHTDFGIEDSERGCQAQWANIPYWPKHIIEQLPGAKKKQKPTTGEIKLTPRQFQIATLIRERGVSNKVIAKTLNITESTVKLHVGLILKKFGLKNRTQLALFGENKNLQLH